jgi:hypothetical protein
MLGGKDRFNTVAQLFSPSASQGLVISGDCAIVAGNNLLRGNKMRNTCAAILAVALVSTSAFAASSTGNLLAPGKPAGVQQAQSGSTVAAIIGGTALLAMAAALISGSGSNSVAGANNPNGLTGATTTTTTST